MDDIVEGKHMTPKQIKDRIAELTEQQEAATHWGAAVGIRQEELNGLYRRLAALVKDIEVDLDEPLSPDDE